MADKIVHPYTQRILGFDILRAFAIITVVIDHGNRLLPDYVNRYFKVFIYDGVTFFFVLSGFLIGSIFIKKFSATTLSLKNMLHFWVKRWMRTLPAYFFILIILLVFYFSSPNSPTFFQSIQFFTFTQNLFYPQPVTFFPEAWSLAVEEWFYLLLPLLILIFVRILHIGFKPAVLFFAIVFIIVVPLIRYGFYLHLKPLDLNTWDIFLRKTVLTRLDSIMFGVAAAYIRFYHAKLWKLRPRVVFSIGVLIILILKFFFQDNVTGFYGSVLSFSILSFATFLLLPYLETIIYFENFVAKTITFIALISYSMYLTNLSVIQISILEKIDLTFIPKVGVIIKYLFYWLLTIGFSYLMYLFIERPFIDLRNKLLKRD